MEVEKKEINDYLSARSLQRNKPVLQGFLGAQMVIFSPNIQSPGATRTEVPSTVMAAAPSHDPERPRSPAPAGHAEADACSIASPNHTRV